MSSPDAVRQRRKEEIPLPDLTTKTSEKAKSTIAARVREEDNAFSFMDIARTIVLLLLASSAVSYFVTRETFTWGVKRPAWTRVETIKTWIAGPQSLTDDDLKAFDGSDPTKPIYLAINGSIYDVSLGRRHYGPGGSYHFFAGKDAARAFVTNCFQEDGNPDLRGVEEMFLPIDDEEIDKLYSSGELKALKEQEKRQAKLQAHNALKHWVDFFAGSKKYPKIGEVRREPNWRTKGPVKKLCQKAQGGRTKRKRPAGK
ncbi:hypothetical protein PZA11_003080 [Diplocarpon coronariae]|uniref:Cytochrome b5 heme-binding domain-containing protein n=1 Tax=Diplocarpon coronariae TaxID=2795749 RepID=A0A218Z096_9HELO|nr:hypothetical protein B2J93_2778 [Marssonina coronariae]